MEGHRPSTGPYSFHFCHRWQRYWLCSQKNHECSANTPGLVVGSYLYITYYYYLAAGCHCGKYSIWPVFLFYPVHKKDWGEDGNRKKRDARKIVKRIDIMLMYFQPFFIRNDSKLRPGRSI